MPDVGVDLLAYFLLVLREAAREGIGLKRAPCELDRVEALLRPRRERVCRQSSPCPAGGVSPGFVAHCEGGIAPKTASGAERYPLCPAPRLPAFW
ncbi:MAG: hypothetical protein ABSF45_14310 [Terriglobia bacterium]